MTQFAKDHCLSAFGRYNNQPKSKRPKTKTRPKLPRAPLPKQRSQVFEDKRRKPPKHKKVVEEPHEFSMFSHWLDDL